MLPYPAASASSPHTPHALAVLWLRKPPVFQRARIHGPPCFRCRVASCIVYSKEGNTNWPVVDPLRKDFTMVQPTEEALTPTGDPAVVEAIELADLAGARIKDTEVSEHACHSTTTE